jgi:hypothetical protein
MLREWLQAHWTLGGVIASLAWFMAGKQSLSNRRPDSACFWLTVGLILLLGACGWAINERQWLSLVVALLVLYVEARSLRRAFAALQGQQ